MALSRILAPILFCSLMLTYGCKQDAPQNTVAQQTATAAQPVRPDCILYAAAVDKLNVREQATKTATVVTQLAEGTIVEGTGEVSANKEEAMLRGVTWLEPYHKINTGTQTGWAHGGALQRIYTGSRTESPDRDALAKLTGFLKTLNTKQLESGKKAWDYVSANYGNSSGPLADAVFILLERFLSRMEREGEFYTLTEKIQWTPEDYEAIAANTFDTKKYPLTQSLAENGFELAEGEGMVFPVVGWNKLQAFFAGKVTAPMKSYLDQEVLEHNRAAWDDGGIIIPIEELADRAMFWEKFNREHPHFVRHEEVRESERWTRIVLVNGADNTPSFDYESGAISEEYKKVWAYILQKSPDGQLGKAVKEISDLCAAEGWKRTKKVEDWQTRFSESNQ